MDYKEAIAFHKFMFKYGLPAMIIVYLMQEFLCP